MRFVSIFFATSIILSSLIYGFILAVDPYNKFGYNLFNFETKAVDFARQNKFNDLEHTTKHYDAFILGSSTAHRYETSVLNQLTGLTSYNYATQSATPEDYISIIRHILSKTTPKLIVLVMDFEVLNSNLKTDEMFYASPLKKFLSEENAQEQKNSLVNNTYLTLEAINDSVKVVWVNLFGKARHNYLADGNHIREKIPGGDIPVKQYSYPNYSICKKRMSYLKTIKELSSKHNFKLVVLTSPLSIEHYQRINNDPDLALQFHSFKKALAEVFTEYYDFTTEGAAAFNERKYFLDSNHPSHDLSNLILTKIFSPEAPKDWPVHFGDLLVTK